ncbi:MAG: hypothetical protein RI973_2258, partial [Bacteroidota bacterium]
FVNHISCRSAALRNGHDRFPGGDVLAEGHSRRCLEGGENIQGKLRESQIAIALFCNYFRRRPENPFPAAEGDVRAFGRPQAGRMPFAGNIGTDGTNFKSLLSLLRQPLPFPGGKCHQQNELPALLSLLPPSFNLHAQPVFQSGDQLLPVSCRHVLDPGLGVIRIR